MHGPDVALRHVGDLTAAYGLAWTPPEWTKPRGPWRTLADVELATVEWVSWFNTARIHTETGHIPPAEYEANYYARRQPDTEAGTNN